MPFTMFWDFSVEWYGLWIPDDFQRFGRSSRDNWWELDWSYRDRAIELLVHGDSTAPPGESLVTAAKALRFLAELDRAANALLKAIISVQTYQITPPWEVIRVEIDELPIGASVKDDVELILTIIGDSDGLWFVRFTHNFSHFYPVAFGRREG